MWWFVIMKEILSIYDKGMAVCLYNACFLNLHDK